MKFSPTIITGASSGIGRALALDLARRGYPVGLIARRNSLLDETVAAIREQGGTACAAVADVSDREALRSAVAAIEAELGPTGVIVANAGYAMPTRLDPLNTAEVEAMFQINLMGVIYAIEAVLPAMLQARSGHLVAISSLAAFKGMPGESAYCGSKAAVNAYMEGLRIALRKTGVAALTVCPGFVRTEMTPMGKMTPFELTAEDAATRIARAIVARRSGLYRFPKRMAWLMGLLVRLPDAVVARVVPMEEEIGG